jgi:hypothetical protein
MGMEIMTIPEELLDEVVEVLRAGLDQVDVSEECLELLEEWILQTEEYLWAMENGD